MSLFSLPRNASFALTLGLTLLGGSLALAQETTDAPVADAASPEGLSMGQSPAEGPGSTYVKEAFSDWELRCIRVESGAEPCQLYQLLKDGQGTSVAEIGLFSLPEGGEAAAGATIIVPLETLLTQGLRLGIDAAQPKIYPFTFCSQVGCVARVGFTAEEVEAFRKGNKAVLTIVPAVAPDQTVSLDVSLAGFTAGFEAVKATLAEEAPAP
jgi:invasion protein IalB